ncbi:hypothetical protein N7528_005850 [Penicillium herquei]|nr:hypothetical protein N7528_005850 [Penicillium herquei]
MLFENLSFESVIAGGIPVIQAAWEGSKFTFEKSTNFTAQAASWSAENPTLAVCAAVGTTGAVLLAAPGAVAAPIISSIGFQAGGIQAGSMAAAVHSSIGNVVSGSAFAMVQSAGAGGSGVVIVNAVTQVGGAAMTMGSAGMAWVKGKL